MEEKEELRSSNFDDEALLDEVKGASGRKFKTTISILNKKTLDPWDMDNVFLVE